MNATETKQHASAGQPAPASVPVLEIHRRAHTGIVAAAFTLWPLVEEMPKLGDREGLRHFADWCLMAHAELRDLYRELEGIGLGRHAETDLQLVGAISTLVAMAATAMAAAELSEDELIRNLTADGHGFELRNAIAHLHYQLERTAKDAGAVEKWAREDERLRRLR